MAHFFNDFFGANMGNMGEEMAGREVDNKKLYELLGVSQ